MPRPHAVLWMVALALTAYANTALAQCQSDSQCKEGRVCRDGVCAAQTCTVDTDCSGTAICVVGECKAAEAGQAAATATAAPPPPPPAPSQPQVQYTTVKRGIMGLYIAGPIVFGVSWITTIVVTAAVATGEGAGTALSYSAIPLAGPWVMMGSDEIDTSGYNPALVISGLLQATGVIMTVLGVAIRRERQVPVYGERDSGLQLAIAPLFTQEGGGGLTAVGTF